MKILKLNTAIALLLMAFVPLMSGCGKDKDKEDDYADTDDRIIREYIAAHNLVAAKTDSGIYYVIDEPGGEQHPNIGNDVRVKYSGYYADGVYFDDNGIPLTFSLRGVIKGWQEGIPLFGKGGKGMLLIPSRLGYGSHPKGNVRPNAVLIFDIHLIDFK